MTLPPRSSSAGSSITCAARPTHCAARTVANSQAPERGDEAARSRLRCAATHSRFAAAGADRSSPWHRAAPAAAPEGKCATLEQALVVFRQADSLGELAPTYDALAAVDADLGDWRSAFDYRTLAQTTATRLLRDQLDQRFASLKVEFDTAARDTEKQAADARE